MSHNHARIRVAVVGHTNTGKTSLLRTLTRDVGFGEIANRPSTTRHVEGAALMVDGQALVAFFDTPGLEDSIGLLEHLENIQPSHSADWVELIERFLDSEAARGEFSQEAKSLRQVVACDIVLYVIDARERVLGKYKDELSILCRTAKPVIPLLNFVDSVDAGTAAWHHYLVRAGLHASLTFNPLVIDATAERKLFEKMRALQDELYQPLGRVIDDLEQQRRRLRRVAADLVADLLIDIAACAVTVPAKDESQHNDIATQLQQEIQTRERDCAAALLKVYGFDNNIYQPEDILLDDPEAGDHLFNLTSLKHLGVQGSSGAAAGAAAGLALDIMVGGLSLGVGTATGAGLGALFNVRGQGLRFINKVRGLTELRVGDTTLQQLGARQLALAHTLLWRGHADPQAVVLESKVLAQYRRLLSEQMPQTLQVARLNASWSRLLSDKKLSADSDREESKNALLAELEQWLT